MNEMIIARGATSFSRPMEFKLSSHIAASAPCGFYDRTTEYSMIKTSIKSFLRVILDIRVPRDLLDPRDQRYVPKQNA